MKPIPTYSDGKNTVTFLRVNNIPGFTHRVIVNGSNRNKDNKMMLLGIGSPSSRNAEFFLSQCTNEVMQ